MKRFAFIRMHANANRVILDCEAPDLAAAVKKIKAVTREVTLDDTGYAKLGDVSFCVAEYFNPFYTI